MTDGQPKGNGTSRRITASPDIPVQWADFRAQLISVGTLIDLSLNPEGWALLGTYLNKLTLLPDDLAELLGLKQDDPTVADALRALSDRGGGDPGEQYAYGLAFGFSG